MDILSSDIVRATIDSFGADQIGSVFHVSDSVFEVNQHESNVCSKAEVITCHILLIPPG